MFGLLEHGGIKLHYRIAISFSTALCLVCETGLEWWLAPRRKLKYCVSPLEGSGAYRTAAFSFVVKQLVKLALVKEGLNPVWMCGLQSSSP